jgi:hypothetical protein
MLVDCDTCRVRTIECDDCVVSLMLVRSDVAVDLNVAEASALGVLAEAGMIPPLRLSPPLLRRVRRGPSSAGVRPHSSTRRACA